MTGVQTCALPIFANKIDHEPAFAWWVPDTLRKKNRIIKAVKRRALKRNYKYGIKVPRNVKEAVEIDKETSTSFWRLAIEKEMLNVNRHLSSSRMTNRYLWAINGFRCE